MCDQKHHIEFKAQPQAQCNNTQQCDNGNLETPDEEKNIQYR